MVFPVVMYGCESWTVKKAEHWRIDAFELWCWRRLLRVPWTGRRSNQSILKEINPGISLEGMMLKLKLQYFGHLMRRVDSLEKNSDAGRDWGQEEKETTEDEMAGWHHRLDGCESEWTLGIGDGQGGLACCDSWGCKESDTTERLNWTELCSVAPSQLCLTLSLPCGLEHTGLPCPSPSSRVCSNSCPLSRWCHPTISISIAPFSSFTQSFPEAGSLSMSQLFASGSQNIGVSASVLPMNIQGWFLLGLTDLIFVKIGFKF